MVRLKLKEGLEPHMKYRRVGVNGMESLDLSKIDSANYENYRHWRIFCCEDCGKEWCNNQCVKPLPPKEPTFDKYEERLADVDELIKEVEKLNKAEADKEKYDKFKPVEFDPKYDYYANYTYEKLKRMFPEIKNTDGKFPKTKREFVENLRKRYVFKEF